jgi:hypothetical protein
VQSSEVEGNTGPFYEIRRFHHVENVCHVFWIVPYSLVYGCCCVGHVDGVRRCIWTSTTNARIVRPTGDIWEWRHDGMILTGEHRRTRRNTCPSATLSTTNPTRLTRAQTRASAMRGQGLTAWAMPRPLCMVTYQIPDDEGYKYLRNVGSHLSLQDYV